ncbi:hypothetical protein NQ176_g6422 [Zarea fungicola]|uniref:Uncharacterized protein n=1 Tax=Zarea fungicola TaxID=93591 RepID=A0ACC1N5R3_9HYPO|nr:hypothetical protein NQ176_g6422 [Lecanicillium fungicola]
MNRLGLIRPEDLTPQQKPLYDLISEYASQTPFVTRYSTGELVGAFALLLHNPSFGRLWFDLDRGVGSLPLTPKIREVAILVVAAQTHCDYEAYAHNVLAELRGITETERLEIAQGNCPDSLGNEEKLAWEVATGLGKPGPLDKGLWDRGIDEVGEESMVSIVHIVGFYHYVSIILNGFDVKVPVNHHS